MTNLKGPLDEELNAITSALGRTDERSVRDDDLTQLRAGWDVLCQSLESQSPAFDEEGLLKSVRQSISRRASLRRRLVWAAACVSLVVAIIGYRSIPSTPESDVADRSPSIAEDPGELESVPAVVAKQWHDDLQPEIRLVHGEVMRVAWNDEDSRPTDRLVRRLLAFESEFNSSQL